jgi:putative oxidoreductase
VRNIIPLIARIFLSAIFLKSALGKIMDPAGTQQFMASYGMPFTGLFLIGAIVLELAGGLSVLIGYKARWGAALLVIFLIPTTLIFHTKFSDAVQMIMFMKNLAIVGGLLMVAYFGAGPVSLDARSASHEKP